MNYADLYAAGTNTDTSHGVSVFAGTVHDPFFIDLGAAFDTANLRTIPGGKGILTSAEDAANQNFVSDTVSGYAVDAIGLVAVHAGGGLSHMPSDGPVVSLWLPMASAAATTCLGFAIMIQALMTAGLIPARVIISCLSL